MRLLLILLLGLALPALLVGFARVVNQLTRSARERAVRRAFAGRALFLWRHRGRWEALVQESVLPALPAGVEPCPRDHERPEARALWLLKPRGMGVPALVLVSCDDIAWYPVHERLERTRAQELPQEELVRELRAQLMEVLSIARARREHAGGAGGPSTPTAAPR